ICAIPPKRKRVMPLTVNPWTRATMACASSWMSTHTKNNSAEINPIIQYVELGNPVKNWGNQRLASDHVKNTRTRNQLICTEISIPNNFPRRSELAIGFLLFLLVAFHYIYSKT